MSEATLIEQRNRLRAAQRKVTELEAAQHVHAEQAARIEKDLRALDIDPDKDLDEQLQALEKDTDDLITRIETDLKKLEADD